MLKRFALATALVLAPALGLADEPAPATEGSPKPTRADKTKANKLARNKDFRAQRASAKHPAETAETPPAK